jgi:phage terminase large subunit-like protein
VARADRYAELVAEELIPAAMVTRLAAQRYLAERAARRSPWRLDHERAALVCRFCEALPHVKGGWALDGQLLRLEDWQVWALVQLFGWTDRRGLRRYRTAYMSVARKNGKTTLLAALMLYMLALDGEPGAEIYSAATTRDQASISWGIARQMARRSPGYRRLTGCRVGAYHLELPDGSRCQALSADAHTLDGLSVHFAAIDELHAHRTRDVWDVIVTATGARRQPLILATTTAGARRDGICWEIDSYSRQTLAGSVDGDRHLGIIYELDEGDAWDDEAAWPKANPNLGVSVSLEDLRHKAVLARASQTALLAFQQKHCNRWVTGDSSWMPMDAWDRCRIDITPAELEGEPCILAMDLASRRDMCALVLLFRRSDRYIVIGRYYVPETQLASGPHARLYQAWHRDGRLIATEGDITDYQEIERDIQELARRYPVRQIVYDPYQATMLATRLTQAGYPLTEIGATVKNFSEPMKRLEELVLRRELAHDGDPVLRWMAANVVVKQDMKGNIFPRKSHPDAKIDGVVALIMALNWDARDPGWARATGGPPPMEIVTQWLS